MNAAHYKQDSNEERFFSAIAARCDVVYMPYAMTTFYPRDAFLHCEFQRLAKLGFVIAGADGGFRITQPRLVYLQSRRVLDY